MRRIKLVVSYDGTAYHGWQKQKSGVKTVEEVLEKALSRLLREETDAHGASRTDAGVHSRAQTVHFDTESILPQERLVGAVNGFLPADIRVTSAEEVSSDFHARHHARRKRYSYRIWTGRIMDPFMRLYCHHYPVDLDVDAMREAAKYFLGRHDFSSFEKNSPATAEDSIREIYLLEVETPGEKEVVINVEGNAFLYNMVRAIAGTLLDVGRGAREPEWVKSVLEARSRSAAGPTLPARGLCLERIDYE